MDWVTPTISGVATVVVALIGLFSFVYRRRRETEESKAPTMVDAYREIDEARQETSYYYRLMRLYEDLFYQVRGALRSLAKRVMDAHPDYDLGHEVIRALEARPPKSETDDAPSL